MGQKSLQSIITNPNIKTLVPYGHHQGSPLGLRLSQNILNNLYLTQIQRDIIIGIMLGDCHIKKMSKNGAPMIQYNQGFVHLTYIFISIFGSSLYSLPFTNTAKRRYTLCTIL